MRIPKLASRIAFRSPFPQSWLPMPLKASAGPCKAQGTTPIGDRRAPSRCRR